MSGILKLSEEWKPLRQDIGSIISQIDSKFEKLEESYQQGAEDMLEAIRLFSNNEESGGMSLDTMKELFGYGNFLVIIENIPPEVIIKKVKQWKEEREKLKETEFKVGDEVEFRDSNCELFKKYVIIRADPSSTVIWLLNLKTFCRIWYDKDKISDLKKTGRHFDTIDIPEGGAII